MSIHNMEKVVVLNMLIANIPKYLNNCPDCAFHKFVLIALFALIAQFITFSLLIRSYFSWSKWLASLGAHNIMEDL